MAKISKAGSILALWVVISFMALGWFSWPPGTAERVSAADSPDSAEAVRILEMDKRLEKHLAREDTDNLAVRMAVLEEQVSLTNKLVYGVLSAVLLQLVAQLMGVLKCSKPRRGD